MFNKLLPRWLKRPKPDPSGDSLPPEQKEAWRVASLLTAYITKKQKRRQRRELNEWLEESDENAELFERLTDEKFVAATKEIFNTLYQLQMKSPLTDPPFSKN